MHRVRLLRHHRIQPYVVFDGGPLPAKQGTESERKKRRDENLARANAFAAQGKHTQAREYYVKCIDVTPQMAYQLIKALRAEGIPYVVAPYEADAQLAYLERIGVVDGVITEDSDLLVFGCRKVLLKLDVVESVVTCISRGDFGSAGAAGGMPLLGWSDAQFRRMAILSGCDYLASIPGVGLKTAWSLLRKHKTVENAVRMLMLEGKKKVPAGYLDAFKLAERVFLYQRVYDPRQKRLVHLTEPAEGERLDAETDAYVGSDIEPALAKQVAEGDACPISLLPMDDINATFVPRALKTIPLNVKDARMPGGGKATGSRQNVGKGTVGILSFFKPRAEGSSGQQTATSHAPGHSITAGRASGKRTLAEVMDHDIAVKRKKQEGAQREGPSREVRNSKFFDVRQSSFGGEDEDAIASEEPDYPVAGPSRITLDAGKDKENVPCADDDEVFMEDAGAVEQEDGYISPSPSMRRWDSPEVSSPLRVRSGAQLDVEEEEDFGADILSSPPVAARQTSPKHAIQKRTQEARSSCPE
ncbi:hypothetical protein EVJ58_g7740 [Rhodofomes roseus]|uniref:XPG-I domain-containing protein n=1 Tax=Rhodofomes roseus TaxID=34475 RepID=A0A4Y9Y2F7_9APHY|nr:hypothetical protein EVJ58_g7740 [Rhodofomes roseus]